MTNKTVADAERLGMPKLAAHRRKHGKDDEMRVNRQLGIGWNEDNDTLRTGEVGTHVGMPATYCIGSDRYATSITRMSATRKTLWTDENDSREVGHKRKYRMGKDGKYRPCGSRSGYLMLGVAENYSDPSF